MMGPKLFGNAGVTPAPGSDSFLCPLANLSTCHLTNRADTLTVLVYNPLPRPTDHLVRIPLGAKYLDARVYDDQGDEAKNDEAPRNSDF